jgi:hypothetical protein
MHGRIVGPVPALAPIQVHVLLPGLHEYQLDRLIELQSTAGSAAYGHYLTPEEFGR